MLAFFISLTLMIGLVQANCLPMDLNKSGPMTNMPIQDQDGAGLCYAYAASQLLDFHFRKNKINITPSPIDLSIQSKGMFAKDIMSGEIYEALQGVNEAGVVDKACIDKQITTFTSKTGMSNAEFAYLIHKIYSDASIFSSDQSEYEGARRYRSDMHLKSCDVQPVLDNLYKRGFWADSVMSILKKTFSDCEVNRKKVPEINFEFHDRGTDKQMLTTLDSILNQNRPASLSACANIFKKADTIRGLKGGLTFVRGYSGNMNKEICGNLHTVLISGRRLDSKKQCQYLVRNSWGAAWNPDDFQCACKTANAYYEVCPNFVGQIKAAKTKDAQVKIIKEAQTRVMVGCWIDQKNLIPNTVDVGSIK